jgi:hypothetical protein
LFQPWNFHNFQNIIVPHKGRGGWVFQLLAYISPTYMISPLFSEQECPCILQVNRINNPKHSPQSLPLVASITNELLDKESWIS